MFTTRSIIAALPVALLLFAPNYVSAAPAPAVVTSLTFTDPGYAVFGELRATFRATQLADGTWSISAVFRPHGLEMLWFNDGFPSGQYVPFHGSASATVTAETGVPIQIIAVGVYFRHPNLGTRVYRDVPCSFLVDADGIVTVQSIWN